MKRFHKVVAGALSIMMFVVSGVPVFGRSLEVAETLREVQSSITENKKREDAEEIDILVMATITMREVVKKTISKEGFENRVVIPLHDDDYNVTAYYVEFGEGEGFAVIYNNKYNPCPIEFGKSSNAGIRMPYEKDPSVKLIYDGPFEEARTKPTDDERIRNYFRNHSTDLDVPNEATMKLIDKYRVTLEALEDGEEGISADVYTNLVDADLEEAEVLFMAQSVLAPESEQYDYWPDRDLTRRFIPLYDDEYSVVAWYLSFDEGGYAVVNNDRLNPAVLEFGKSDNPQILELLESSPNARIIYDNPFSVRTEAYGWKERMIGDGVKDFHYFNAAFEQPDVETAQFLHEAMIEREPGQNQIRTYDFDDPVTGYVQGIGRLPYVPADSWMTEAWYHQAANNNVACTATVTATNLAILFRRMGYSNAASNSPISTFNNIAEEMGVQSAWNANGLDNYFSEHNYEVDYELSTSVNSSQYQLYNEIKDGVILGNPSVIAASKTSGFSWVLGVGWLETTDGHFVEVVSSTAASDGLYFRVESRVMNSVFVYETGSFNADTGAFLERLYLKCLNRIPPDEEGFLDWLGVLYNPNYGGGTVARGFFLSQEYENRGRTNADFLEDLYYALFDREPDYSGYNAWLNLLEMGRSRSDIVNGFIGSQEFAILCNQYGITV